MTEKPKYNDTYYEFTQIKSCVITLWNETEIKLSDIDPPIDWRMIFGNDNPVEIEIGCGKGRFLLEASKRCPEINYVGIERAPKYVQHTRERLLKHNAKRVLVVWSDAPYFVNCYLADNSVKAYHIYFPDPWPKKRQRKRRIFNNDLWIQGLIRTLQPNGGQIHIATDYAEYFHEIHDRLTQSPPLFHIPPDSVEAVHIPTNFEMKYVKEGRQIYRAVYALREEASGEKEIEARKPLPQNYDAP